MKTASDWIKQFNGDFKSDICSVSAMDIKAIQLDAYEKGIRDAAEVAETIESEHCLKIADESPWPSVAILATLTKPKDKE